MSVSRSQQPANEHKMNTKGAPSKPAVVIDRPTLDFNNKMLLQGKKDKVEELVSIRVEFFPNNGMETYYMMNVDGEPIRMSVGEFNQFCMMKKKKNSAEHEETAAHGFVTKLYKRTFVQLGDDVDVNAIRAIQARPFPPVISKMMGKTQGEMSLSKFNDFPVVLNHWNRMNEDTKTAMENFQDLVCPGISWKAELERVTAAFEEKEAASARAKAMKQAGVSLTPPAAKTELESEMNKIEAGKKEKRHDVERTKVKFQGTTTIQSEDGSKKIVEDTDDPLLGVPVSTT
jgi:hypothetical protein